MNTPIMGFTVECLLIVTILSKEKAQGSALKNCYVMDSAYLLQIVS